MYTKPISYSGMSLYAKCPKKWHSAYILGIREPSGVAAERGVMLHEMLEYYFKDAACYPTGNSCLAKWQPYMSDLKAQGLVAEGEIAVFEDWTPAKFDDVTAWARGLVDGDLPDTVYDWKSGKIYEDHWKQGVLYCAMKKSHTAKFVYLDIPHHVQTWTYTDDELDDFRGQIDDKIRIIRADEEWLPNPGRECNWCKLSWRNGGNCTSAP